MGGMTHLFTPRVGDDRAIMCIDDIDLAKIKAWHRQPGSEAVVTDRTTGKRYLVRSAECQIPGCHCDAVVVSEANLQ
jgi:hypothetical protein